MCSRVPDLYCTVVQVQVPAVAQSLRYAGGFAVSLRNMWSASRLMSTPTFFRFATAETRCDSFRPEL